ncbi:aaa-like domain protein [Lasius niger]|uniref:Aaa-like domain protein n=1 Tax=Lasius niger TaxID=67767 RepID=A0A0J7JTW1_LASNI|nr:aaa-like domain protein [Lasius niger]
MLDLMAVSSVQGATPLYLHVVTRILRDLRMQQQATNEPFNYAAFRRALDAEELTPGQLAPLKQRLDTLESFMVQQQVAKTKRKKGLAENSVNRGGSDWTPKVTIYFPR